MNRKPSTIDVATACLDAAWDHSAWPSTLKTLADHLNIGSVTLESYGGDDLDALWDFQSTGIDVEAIASYMQHFRHCNPRHPALKASHRGDVVYDKAILSEREMNGDEFYGGLLAPLGLRYFAATTLERSSARLSLLALHLPREKGHVDKPVVSALATLGPVFYRAYDISRSTSSLHDRVDNMQQVFEQLSVGLIVLDRNGAVLQCNPAAARICRQHGEISVVRGALVFRDTQIDGLCGQLVRDALAEQFVNPVSSLWLPVDGGARFYTLDIVPIIAGGSLTDRFKLAVGERRVAIVIRPAGRSRQVSDNLLRYCFALTGKEAALARALVNGSTLDEHAQRQRVKMSTVRTQYASLRAKIGARNQADVVRILSPLLLD